MAQHKRYNSQISAMSPVSFKTERHAPNRKMFDLKENLETEDSFIESDRQLFYNTMKVSAGAINQPRIKSFSVVGPMSTRNA